MSTRGRCKQREERKLCLCLCVLVVTVTVNGQMVGDFDVTTNDKDFEFVYHKYQNLLLTIHNDTCYFATMDRSLHDDLLGQFQQDLEGKIVSAITSGEEGVVHQSSLQDVRDQFRDLLALYLCDGLDIFTVHIDYMACDFEQSTTCSWTISQQVRVPWVIHNGETSTPLTGPEFDHTVDNPSGHYAYMEADDLNPGDVAELISPAVNVTRTDGLCLHFFANMYGRDVGRLEVYAKRGSDTTTLWTKSGDQSKGWKVVEVAISPSLSGPDGVRVVIRATRGPGVFGDVAIDDISSAPGECLHSKLGCSFENNDLCQWSQEVFYDDMQWHIHSGATTTQHTGPHGAPTVSEGSNTYYVYLEANDGHVGERADLRSPLLVLDEAICLHFFFSMAGSGVGELHVLTVDFHSREETQLLTLQGDQGDNWRETEVTIIPPDQGTEIMVVFRAVRGRSSLGDIAIDHISSQGGPCGQWA